MADQRIFGKTPKGTAELAVRSGALSQAQRRLLILVDGIRDAAELAAIVPSGFDEALRFLEDGGYVELTGHSTRTVQPASTSIPESQLTTVQEARNRAAVSIRQLLGPGVETLAAAMEAAASGDELRPLVREAERLVAETHGAATAQAFIFGIRHR
jgi:hypothetical protein